MRFARLDDSLVTPLSKMLMGIEGSFRPFGFTPAEIRRAVHEEDEHWVVVSNHDSLMRGSVLAYGMLRGWHEGYHLPCLGVAVNRLWRRRGLGTSMILFLHHRAAERGATEVMLHVDEDNPQAQSLYLSLGYRPDGDRWLCRLKN